ncbi:MAG: hypothetical protein JWM36_2898 [Hyphomicrobiales bacterium]|nr:hypothetical protein [Hyphomicrobiales bacterium]
MTDRAFLPLAILLALPLLAFDFGFLNPVPGLASTGLLLGALFLTFRGARAQPPVDWRLIAPCLMMGLLVILLSGAGHMFYQTDDWSIRDALLVDLTRQPWPFSYEDAGKLQVLRAPLGLYLVPALVGKAGGLLAADVAMLAQNGVLTGLILYLFAREAATRRSQSIILTVFLLFAGLDMVPILGQIVGGGQFFAHPDAWSGLEYSSHVTLLFWVPNHCLAGWSFAAAYVGWRRGQASLGALGLFFALALFWSPLAMMGALPMLLFAAVCALRNGTLTWSQVPTPALAGLAALPVFLFMTRDTSAVPSGFISGKSFYLAYAGLLATDVLPGVAFVWLGLSTAKDAARPRAELALIAAAMVLSPLYSLGVGNDFSRRAIIPLMAVLALAFATSLVQIVETGRLWGQRWILPVMLLAAMNPAVEIIRNIVLPKTALSTCNLLDAWRSGPDRDVAMSSYFADASAFTSLPSLFRPPSGEAVKAEGRRCWGDGKRPFLYNAPLLDKD